eukprot:CAMPEP_0194090132 /NCGR_PEP_ID=MMETSP0149-20130528/37637_1 /TAXON_ID=122233 /ORGANISM="Chaetoceros debilis, Strain MM31A-1" /LENGTH=405 /DNA_ID=CAMNT_0038774279 /DNA_START=100 /DNA_END=1314 /DNA_ORIENTATION=-
MLPGSRIRLMKPPSGRKDLQSTEGCVMSLIPRACDPLCYKVAFPKEGSVSGSSVSDNFDELELPSTSIQLLDYDDDNDDGVDTPASTPTEDMLRVNGLCYCKDHRLESCGKCGYDFRCQNIINELNGDVDTGMRLDEELRFMGAPVRRAPAKNLEPSPFESYNAVINDAVHGINLGFNVIALDDFPRDKLLLNAFESQFLVNMFPRQDEEPSKRPLYQVRKLFTTFGSFLDTAIQGKQALPRIYLQDEAQSEVLNMDIIAIKLSVGEFAPGLKVRLPIIVVAWSRVRSGDFKGMQASLRALHPGTPMGEIRAAPHEIELFAKIIEANSALVASEDLSFLRENVLKDTPTLNIGVIAPISSKKNDEYYELLGNYCDLCATSQCVLKNCSRCKVVMYCSKSCQKSGW